MQITGGKSRLIVIISISDYGGYTWPRSLDHKNIRFDVLMVRMEGIRDGSETKTDRVRVEGKDGFGDGVQRPH